MIVVALAGRRIDAPGADTPRFPLENVGAVRGKIQAFFSALRPSFLVCSGACGADLLALEVAGELGIRRCLVLPFAKEPFLELSVRDRPGWWEEVFETAYGAVQQEAGLVVLPYTANDEKAFEKTNEAILDRAEALAPGGAGNKSGQAVVVWEGRAKAQGDTTEHFRQRALARNFTVTSIITI